MGNRIRIDGTWYHIDDLDEQCPVVDLHSVRYEPDGRVYRIRFGTTVLELTAGQAKALMISMIRTVE